MGDAEWAGTEVSPSCNVDSPKLDLLAGLVVAGQKTCQVGAYA